MNLLPYITNVLDVTEKSQIELGGFTFLNIYLFLETI